MKYDGKITQNVKWGRKDNELKDSKRDIFKLSFARNLS